MSKKTIQYLIKKKSTKLKHEVTGEITSAHRLLRNLLWTFSLKLSGTGSKIGDRLLWCIS
jgi:hypothetical protein